VVAVVAAWRLTPLRTLLSADRVAASATRSPITRRRRSPCWAPTWSGRWCSSRSRCCSGDRAAVPRPTAIVYCLVGRLSAACTTYGIGRLVGRFRPRWLEQPRLLRIRRQLRRRGILAVIAARLLPVGNFTLINITAGALGIRFRDYLIGNAIGLLPGVLALTVFADRIGATLRHRRPTT
jgi:membrane protein YqaA with SNARE-associated domain